MVKISREACKQLDWHEGDQCRYDDVRNLVGSFEVVDERWKRIKVEVMHQIATLDGPDGPETFATALFRLSGIRTRKPEFDQNVNDNIDLVGPLYNEDGV